MQTDKKPTGPGGSPHYEDAPTRQAPAEAGSGPRVDPRTGTGSPPADPGEQPGEGEDTGEPTGGSDGDPAQGDRTEEKE